MDQLLLEVVIN